MTEENDEDCGDPLEASGPTCCLRQGQIGQAPQGCVQLSSVYPWHTVSTTSLSLLISAFDCLHFEKKNKSCHNKISGLDQCECEKHYYFSFPLRMCSLFNNFAPPQMLLSA